MTRVRVGRFSKPRADLALLTLLWLAFFTLGSPNFSFSTQISFVVIVVAATSLILRSYGKSSTELVLKQKTPYLIVLILGVSLALQLISAYLNEFRLDDNLAGLLTVILGVFAVSRSSQNLLLRSFYVSATVFILAGWISEFTSSAPVFYESGFGFNVLGHRFAGLSVHPNVMGLLSAILFGISLLKYRQLFISITSLGTLVFTENRGGLLAAALVIVLWGVSLRAPGKKVLVATALGTFAGLAYVLFGGVREGASDLTSGRLDIWSICQTKIEEGRFFGFGPNSIARMYGVDTVEWFRPFHCHNQVLDDSVNFGIFLAVVNLVIVVAVSIHNYRTKNFVFLSVFTAFISAQLFESPVRLFASAGSIWFLFCFLAFYFASFRVTSPRDSSSEK
jgi:hypothetical protein